MHRKCFLFLLLFCVTQAGNAAIYRCTAADGATTFAQFPCGKSEEVVEIEIHNLIKVTPLSEAEQARLTALAKTTDARRQNRRQQVLALERNQSRRRVERRQLCQAALAGLADVRATRRGGYSLSEARSLSDEERRLKRQRSLNC